MGEKVYNKSDYLWPVMEGVSKQSNLLEGQYTLIIINLFAVENGFFIQCRM